METKTEKLSDLALEISPTTKIAELHSILSGKLGWPSTDGLERCGLYVLCRLRGSRSSPAKGLRKPCDDILQHTHAHAFEDSTNNHNSQQLYLSSQA